jgi:hypothetical protein
VDQNGGEMTALLKTGLGTSSFSLFVGFQDLGRGPSRLLLASVSVTRTSMMQSVPRSQKPRISKSPQAHRFFLRSAGNWGLG